MFSCHLSFAGYHRKGPCQSVFPCQSSSLSSWQTIPSFLNLHLHFPPLDNGCSCPKCTCDLQHAGLKWYYYDVLSCPNWFSLSLCHGSFEPDRAFPSWLSPSSLHGYGCESASAWAALRVNPRGQYCCGVGIRSSPPSCGCISRWPAGSSVAWKVG